MNVNDILWKGKLNAKITKEYEQRKKKRTGRVHPCTLGINERKACHWTDQMGTNYSKPTMILNTFEYRRQFYIKRAEILEQLCYK
jgi:hypothetical protein